MTEKFTIIILAGGLATRLYPETIKIPKSLISINGYPFIKHQLELLKLKGITNIVLSLGNLGEQIKKYVEENNNFDINIEYSFDGDILLGTGGAIYNAFPLLSNPFGVLYGDSFLNIDYLNIINYFNEHKCTGLMTVLKNENKWDKSNVKFEDGIVKEYSKEIKGNYSFIDFGFSIFRKESFDDFKAQSIFDLKEIIQDLVSKCRMSGYEVFERFYEIGSLNGIEETGEYIKNII